MRDPARTHKSYHVALKRRCLHTGQIWTTWSTPNKTCVKLLSCFEFHEHVLFLNATVSPSLLHPLNTVTMAWKIITICANCGCSSHRVNQRLLSDTRFAMVTTQHGLWRHNQGFERESRSHCYGTARLASNVTTRVQQHEYYVHPVMWVRCKRF
jgi:hypothetical protein